jgi:hypothetical protein
MALSTWLRNWKDTLERQWTLRRRLYRRDNARSKLPCLEALEERWLLSAYVVTSTADDGSPGTLRAAINAVNAGQDNEIDFHIGAVGSAQTINIKSALPALTANGVYVNGLSQGGNGNTTPLIELDGAIAGSNSNGLVLDGSAGKVSGLLIEHFGVNGIVVEGSNSTIGGTSAGAGNVLAANGNDGLVIGSGASGVEVQGNYIGTNASGTSAWGNSIAGIEVDGSHNTIGGTSTAARNIISANGGSVGTSITSGFGYGILISGASGVLVQGNYIGTNADGDAALGNSGKGIKVSGSHNTIGGSVAGAGNLISGNTSDGIYIDFNYSGVLVEGNFVGLNAAGTSAIPNSAVGVAVFGNDNTIGGTVAGARNVLSGNGSTNGSFTSNAFPGYGLGLFGASGTLVQGNYIGTNAAGTTAVPNGYGIADSGSDNTIGGTVDGARNIISGNPDGGVVITQSGNLVQGNFIGTNAAGTAALGNNAVGIDVLASDNTIGGSVAAAGNTIAHNADEGVLVRQGNSNTIRHNWIFANGPNGQGPGIVLFGNANDSQAAPLLTHAHFNRTKLKVKGFFTAPKANVSYVLEFFANPSGDAEGKIFLVSKVVTPTTTGAIKFAFKIHTSVPRTYPLITATLTNAASDTSAFSSGVTAT